MALLPVFDNRENEEFPLLSVLRRGEEKNTEKEPHRDCQTDRKTERCLLFAILTMAFLTLKEKSKHTLSGGMNLPAIDSQPSKRLAIFLLDHFTQLSPGRQEYSAVLDATSR